MCTFHRNVSDIASWGMNYTNQICGFENEVFCPYTSHVISFA